MRERTIERRLRERVEAAGGRAFKWVSPANRSVPDRIVMMPRGRVFLVELKAPGRKQTALQAHTAAELRGLGFRVVVLDSIEAVDRWVDREQGRKNKPIEELLAEYRAEGCDFDDMAFVRRAALRYVRTMADSQVRALLYVLASRDA